MPCQSAYPPKTPVVPPRVVTKPLASVSYPVDLHAQAATELIDNGASVGFVELSMCHRAPLRGITTKLTGGNGAQRNCRPVERRVSSQLFAPDALVHGARPCAQIHSPTLSMPHTCAGCRCHAWQRTPAHALAFLQRLDHYASSSPISSSGEHSTGQAKPKSDTALITIVRVLALLICLKFQVIR